MEYSIVADKDAYTTDEIITLTVVTDTDIVKLGIFNEAGKGITQISNAYVDEGEVRTWTVTIKIATRGFRTISAKALKDGENFEDVEYFGSVSMTMTMPDPPEVVPEDPMIIEITAPETVKVRETFTITVKTNLTTEKIGLYNVNGSGISTSRSYIDQDGVRIWTVVTNVATAGNRTLTFKVADADGNWIEDTAKDFNIVLTKK